MPTDKKRLYTGIYKEDMKDYHKFCKKHGYIASKRIPVLMKADMEGKLKEL